MDGSGTVTIVSASQLSWWIWAAGGGAVAVVVLLVRRKKRTTAETKEKRGARFFRVPLFSYITR